MLLRSKMQQENVHLSSAAFISQYMEFTAILISIRHILSFCASSVSEVEGCDVAMNLPLYQAVGDGKIYLNQ